MLNSDVYRPKGYEKSDLYKTYPELYDAVFIHHRNVLITGAGGVGKSHSINMIKKESNRVSRQCDITSTTGVSAHAISGTTIHRWSSIQLGDKPARTIIEKIRKNKEKVARWKASDILVIDEVSMLGAKILTLLDTVAKEIRLGRKEITMRKDDNISIPAFGGVQVIMSADFLQLPPIDDDYAFKSSVWEDLNLFYFRMTHPYRYPDPEHFDRLMRIRLGEHTKEDVEQLLSRVKAYDEYKNNEKIGKLNNNIRPTRIYPLKKDVEYINLEELEKLDGDTIMYECEDIISIKTTDIRSTR